MTDLDTLTAHLELHRGKARYCRTLDTKDWDGFGELMTDDIVLDVSDGEGGPPVTGRDDAVELVRSSVATARTAHQVHNPDIDLDGDTARVVWPMQDRVVFDNGVGLTGYGHYHETWVRHSGVWKMASLTLTRLIVEYDGVPTTD